MPQSGQLLLFFPPENDKSRQLDVSERAGEEGAGDGMEDTEEEGESAGEDDLEEDMLRSTGSLCWCWRLDRARMA